MQEYTRSGRISEMTILDNKEMLRITGPGPIRDYYEKVNFFIYSTIQSLNYCSNVKQDFGAIHKTKEISRVSTISMAQLQDTEEKFLFPLDNITESCYYINIEEEDLDNDDTILPMVQQIVRENISKDRDSSFAIWKAADPSNYIVKHYTHYIQEPDGL